MHTLSHLNFQRSVICRKVTAYRADKETNSEERSDYLNCTHLSWYICKRHGREWTSSPQLWYLWALGSSRRSGIKCLWNNKNNGWADTQRNISQPGFPRQERPAALETHRTSRGEPALPNPAQPLFWPVTTGVSGFIGLTDEKTQIQRGKANGPIWTVGRAGAPTLQP